MLESLEKVKLLNTYMKCNNYANDFLYEKVKEKLGKYLWLENNLKSYTIGNSSEDILNTIKLNNFTSETELFKALINIHGEVCDEITAYYNSPVEDRYAINLFMIIPNRDLDKVNYIYAKNEFDAVFIYSKMCGCLVPDTFAIPVYGVFLEEGYNIKENTNITFKKQCELNCYVYEGDNPKVEL